MPSLAIDTSNNNPADEADVIRMTHAGVRVLWAKATEGAHYRDPWYYNQRHLARKHGLIFGSYLFLHSGVNGGEQAREFLDYAQPRPGEFVVIDAEDGGIDPGDTPLTMAARVHEAGAILHGTLGTLPYLYTGAFFLRGMLPHLGDTARLLPIIEAQYPGRQPAAAWSPWLRHQRIRFGRGYTVHAWQFTDRYRLGARAFDASVLLVDPHRLHVVPARRGRV